ncbi:hypothetical protein [uncultured Methylobacterium sp.]|uniref:hypothetical protein n=1 Tax=uncultured Methylobacterium sp. TaxID=157278 RepID=UPI0035CC84B5
MAKRERYDVALKCDGCEHEGRMGAEEDENPIGGLHRDIEWVSDGFRVEGSKIICEKCGTTVLG